METYRIEIALTSNDTMENIQEVVTQMLLDDGAPLFYGVSKISITKEEK